MISYAKYKAFWKVHILLDDSTEFQNLLKAFIGMEKKILGRSGLFSKVQEPSR